MVGNAIRRGVEMDSPFGPASLEKHPTNFRPFIGPFDEVNASIMGVSAYGRWPGFFRREAPSRTPSSKCLTKLEAV